MNLYWRIWSKKKQINAYRKKKIYVQKSEKNPQKRIQMMTADVQDTNSTDGSSEPKDEMETGSINGNFKTVFDCPARINFHTFLVEQVLS